jgi:hypothetical protein
LFLKFTELFQTKMRKMVKDITAFDTAGPEAEPN